LLDLNVETNGRVQAGRSSLPARRAI